MQVATCNFAIHRDLNSKNWVSKNDIIFPILKELKVLDCKKGIVFAYPNSSN